MEKLGSKMELKCAIDHILDAERRGEINYDNVLYIVENINVAGTSRTLLIQYFIVLCTFMRNRSLTCLRSV